MKVIIPALAALVLLSTTLYAYERWQEAEMKYELLKGEYLRILEVEREQKQDEVKLLENCSKNVEKLEAEKRDAYRELSYLRSLISSNPEKWIVRLEGSVEHRLQKAKEAILSSLSSPIVLKYAEMINVSNAVYINGERFSFDYAEDEALFEVSDAIVNPEWFLVHRIGDCDDVAAAMAAVLKAKGYDVKLCVGERGNESSKHAWVRLNGEDVDYSYCVNRVCKLEVGYFGNIAEKCVDI